MEKRSKREEIKRMLLPMLFLFVVLLIFSILKGDFSNVGKSTEATIDQIGTHLVFQFLSQVFPFITCWAFVIRNNKSDKHIWINYIIWTILASISPLMDLGII